MKYTYFIKNIQIDGLSRLILKLPLQKIIYLLIIPVLSEVNSVIWEEN